MFFVLLFLFCFNIDANIGTAGFKDYPNYYFVETGTFNGYGVERALHAGCFKEIYSIEVDQKFVNENLYRFRNFKNVFIRHGNANNNLWNIIKNLDKPITFWLDAHVYPGKEGEQNCPLLEELEQIKMHPIKTHTILIDDMSCSGTIHFDYITKDDLIEKIKEINPNYKIKYIVGGNDDEAKDNIMLAYIE